MRINTNVSSLNAHRNLTQTQNALSDSMGKLSSGFRINRAADDAAGLGIANVLRATNRSLVQASRNAEQANSLAQIAEGSVSGIQNMLERMKELATQANSDTVDDAGRGRLQAEFDALTEEIGRTAATTQFGETKLIDGDGDDFQFMVGSSGDYEGNDLLSFKRLDMTAETLGLIDGEDNLSIESLADAQATLEALDEAIDTVNVALGDIGAFQNRIENAMDNLQTSIQNLSASESVIRDLDMAAEMTQFSKNQILSQAGTAMLAQANQSTSAVLQLLG